MNPAMASATTGTPIKSTARMMERRSRRGGLVFSAAGLAGALAGAFAMALSSGIVGGLLLAGLCARRGIGFGQVAANGGEHLHQQGFIGLGDSGLGLGLRLGAHFPKPVEQGMGVI